eukprot:31170-Pelagococcus_subviridis.AAC.2
MSFTPFASNVGFTSRRSCIANSQQKNQPNDRRKTTTALSSSRHCALRAIPCKHRGRGLKARDPGRRETTAKVLKDQRSLRRRDRMGTSVRRTHLTSTSSPSDARWIITPRSAARGSAGASAGGWDSGDVARPGGGDADADADADARATTTTRRRLRTRDGTKRGDDDVDVSGDATRRARSGDGARWRERKRGTRGRTRRTAGRARGGVTTPRARSPPRAP